jgi:hypothetical protein
MPYVLCTVSDGLRASEVTVEVQDENQRPEYLRVHREFVKRINDRNYLPIGVVGQDKDMILIELPHEADSGANRLWVGRASLLDPQPQSELAAS